MVDPLFSSQNTFGITIGGEYSTGFNDCGFYLRRVEPYVPNNPNCAFWDDWQNWDQATKDGVLNFALASMDAIENPFFWTWKVRKPGRPLIVRRTDCSLDREYAQRFHWVTTLVLQTRSREWLVTDRPAQVSRQMRRPRCERQIRWHLPSVANWW